MRCAIAHPCIGSRAMVFKMSRSRVPCTRSVGLVMRLSLSYLQGIYSLFLALVNNQRVLQKMPRWSADLGGDEITEMVLAAVFPWRVINDEGYHRLLIRSFHDFQNYDGVVAVILADIDKLTFEIRGQVFQDRGGSLAFYEVFAVQEAVRFLCSGKKLLREILLVASDYMQNCHAARAEATKDVAVF